MTVSIPLLVLFGIFMLGVGFYMGRAKIGRSFSDYAAPELSEIQSEAQEAVHARIEKRKSRIIALAEKQGKVTNDDVEDLFCISNSTARRYLDELEQDGHLTQHGETGRGVHYELKR